METPESLRKTIEQGIESNLSYRNDEYDFMLQQLWIVMFETTLVLKRSVEVLKVNLLSDKEIACMMILTNCIVDSHASYQSLRAGFHRAAAITARGMLENMSLAVAMKLDETDDIFNQYKQINTIFLMLLPLRKRSSLT